MSAVDGGMPRWVSEAGSRVQGLKRMLSARGPSLRRLTEDALVVIWTVGCFPCLVRWTSVSRSGNSSNSLPLRFSQDVCIVDGMISNGTNYTYRVAVAVGTKFRPRINSVQPCGKSLLNLSVARGNIRKFSAHDWPEFFPAVPSLLYSLSTRYLPCSARPAGS